MATKATTGRTRKKTVETDTAKTPEFDEIAKRAYELYQSGADGGDVAHWLKAEQELVGAPA